jgi:ferredoxin-NADP reductase
MRLMRLRVIEKQFVATETVRIRLARDGDSRIGPFRPGAHIEIEFAGYTRRYSLTSDPEDPSYLEFCVLRVRSRVGIGPLILMQGDFDTRCLSVYACEAAFRTKSAS